MRPPLKEGASWAAAFAAALPAFIFPLYNPDLFWHLSAGREILRSGALPRTETLSFTMAGAPWLDFEWLSQLIFQGAYQAGGFVSLWALKVLLVALCALAFDAAARAAGARSAAARAGGLVAWSAAALAWSDIRPELFSILFFTLCVWKLERIRADAAEPDLRAALEAAVLFALWSNLHAGFPVALTMAAVYAAAELIAGRPRRAARVAALALAGAAGALLNPYGAGPYQVALEHFRQRADLAKYILEWHPMSAANPIHWPFYGLAALALFAAAARLAEPYKGAAHWRRPAPWALILASGHFAANALLHARMAAFFGVTAALLVAAVLEEARGWTRRALLTGLAAGLLFVAWLAPRVSWGVFNDKFVPRRAAEFMARQEPALAPLRLYNEWEWGGYLSWRLRPWFRVFADGRYVFHDLLGVVSRATESPESFREFFYRYKLSGGLVHNRAALYPSVRRYPDGSEKLFNRPWYVSFFPKEHWALVYWDDQALLFVSRREAPATWLAAHEYRWLRPRDAEAFADALERGEVPKDALARERARHAEETALALTGG